MGDFISPWALTGRPAQVKSASADVMLTLSIKNRVKRSIAFPSTSPSQVGHCCAIYLSRSIAFAYKTTSRPSQPHSLISHDKFITNFLTWEPLQFDYSKSQKKKNNKKRKKSKQKQNKTGKLKLLLPTKPWHLLHDHILISSIIPMANLILSRSFDHQRLASL